MEKKHYIKPEIVWMEIDNTISLQMQSGTPPDGPPIRGDGSKGKGTDPFANPFDKKPFG